MTYAMQVSSYFTDWKKQTVSHADTVCESTRFDSQMELFDLISKGLDFEYFQKLLAEGVWTRQELVALLDVSEKTIMRYEKDNKPLTSAMTARLIDLGKVFHLGMNTFEDKELFKEWLRTPTIVFQRREPAEFLSNSEGVQMVLDELNRIEWGVYA